ncbi:MAG: hypothetical protein HC802_04500 [Caldilineaceae bacterium]|nr:hypothetical protein [Caldilineaceae bacterium]
MTPFWVLPLAIFAEQLDRWLNLGWHRNRRSLIYALRRLRVGVWVMVVAALLSFGVQLLAVSLNYVNFEIQLRERYPTNWEDPLEFGPPAQAVTDLLDSPVIGQLRLLVQGLAVNSDLGWLWSDGNVQWLVVLVAAAVIATYAFLFGAWWMAARSGREEEAVASLPMRILAPILLVLLLSTWLAELTHVTHYGVPGQGYRSVIDEICRQSTEDDVVVTVAPFSYQIPMNWLPAACADQPPIFGYATSSMVNPEAQNALAQALQSHDRVWFVTSGLAANDPDNTVERWLAGAAFKSSDVWYDDYRLLQYATEGALADSPVANLSIPLGDEGEAAVIILSARAPAVVESGQVAPVEINYSLAVPATGDLRWFVQLLAPDGQAAALLDTGPMDGYGSFSQLPTGQELTERAALHLPLHMAPGMYQLIAGLYDPGRDGAPRLRTPDGSDFVQLGILEVVN